MDDYKDIRDLLKPRRDIKASDNLREKVRSALAQERRKHEARRWMVGSLCIMTAAAAVMLFVLLPSGLSAKSVLADAIDAFRHAETVDMTVEVRTRPVENFRYIDMNEDFVRHHVRIADADSLLRWRIDKGERVATGTGRDIYTWMPSLRLGWHINGSDYENILGYLATLLTPRKILEYESDNCTNGNREDYKIDKKDGDIILTCHAAPQGNFENPYLLNTSIAESENVRRYVIDAESKRLKSATVSVVSGGREVEVLKVSEIKYNQQTKENICVLPDGIRFIETDEQPDGLKGLSAEEAASTVLNAFADWDEGILNQMLPREWADAAYRESLRGSKLISIGRSFTSGSGNSVFVPYTLELRDGTRYRHNIALQRTDTGGWVVVGGL